MSKPPTSRIDSGRHDDSSESHDAGIEMADRMAMGTDLNFDDNDLPATLDESHDPSQLLHAAADFDDGSSSGATPPNAASGYDRAPPPAVLGTQPLPSLPVPLNVVPLANATNGSLGAAAVAPLAVPAVQVAVQNQAQVAVQQNGGNLGAAERNCLQNHWKLIAGVVGLTSVVTLGLGLGLGLGLARDSVAPIPPTTPPTPPTPGAQQITVTSDFVSNGLPVTSVVIDLTDTKLQSAGLHGFDVASFAFVMPDGMDNGMDNSDRRTSVHGVYKFDKTAKTLTFFPIVSFPGGMASVDFTVTNPDKTSTTTTLAGTVVLTYPIKPVVYDQLIDHGYDITKPVTVNVVTGTLVTTGLKGRALAAKAGTDALNPASVSFTGFEILDPLDTTTKPAYSNMNQTMQVPNQGTWTVDTTGTVTFTPISGFNDAPYPATFQVGDAKGRPSNVARVIINSDIINVFNQIEAFAKGPDATFWTAYETALIRAKPPVDAAQWNEVNALALAYTLMHITPAARTAAEAVTTTTYTTTLIDNAYADWLMGAFDPQGNPTRAAFDRVYLWDTYIAKITDTATGLTASPLGTRLVRLTTLNRLLARYFKDAN